MDIAPYLPQLVLAWSIQLMGVVSPGPGVALIMSVAVSHGRMPSLMTSLGIACAAIIWATITVLGLAAIFAQMAELITIVRLIGASYLLWLAYKAFKTAVNPQPLDLTGAPNISARRAWLAGFIMQLANPKAIFFWLAIASVGGVGSAPLPIVMLFVAVAFVISFAGHGGYALLLSSGPVRRAYGRARRWIEGALGTFFLFASYKLVTARV